MIKDDLGRTFGSLRISLTDLCNLACTYCTPDDKRLSVKEISEQIKGRKYLKQVKALHEICHFEEVRLTGGEPLLFQGIEVLISELKKIGLPKVKLTTNGVVLGAKARLLKQAGLENVNVSLDALDKDRYSAMSRRNNLSQVLKSIEIAKLEGLNPKVNAVIMRGINEDQIIPLFNYFHERRIPLRYLEFMQMGHLHTDYERYLYSQAEILEKLSQEANFIPLERPKASTANYWQLSDGYQFGIIANTSRPFCEDCDRLRIGSDGKVYGCLSNEVGFDYDPDLSTKEQTIRLLENALALKQRLSFQGSELSMKFIGG